ncbi:MAG: prephenate dehydrogenase/arogenate dehydrogenase family protein [Chloroflexi bacterium]|nr:prephenate dehydrogenase/arogenate dehydrogenase family protein [Chloroflexota bacterium]
MAKSQITIIGLGLAGASLGLALRQGGSDFEIVGHDKSPEIAGGAKRLGAVDRTEWNLHRACTGAGLVIIDGPLTELKEVLGHIAEDLSSGAVVVALSDVMQPALGIGAAALKENAFVAAHPILNRVGGELEARANLFAQSQFCIGAGVETPPEALELVNNLALRADATPFYIDPTEHDGIISLLEQTPRLLAAALMQAGSNSSGWRDGQKLAGRAFANATESVDDPSALAGALFANRESLLRSLEQMEETLGEWRALLKAEDDAALRAALAEMNDRRLRWQRDVKLQTWDSADEPVKEEQPGLLRQMFFGDLFGGRRRKPDDEK